MIFLSNTSATEPLSGDQMITAYVILCKYIQSPNKSLKIQAAEYIKLLANMAGFEIKEK